MIAAKTVATAWMMLMAGVWLTGAQALSGDEILERASSAGGLSAEGSRLNLIEFQITDRNDISFTRKFAFFSKTEAEQPDRLLIYFLEPELERGTIFLSVGSGEPDGDPRLWLFLSALGQAKELISDQDRNAGFAGSNLQNDQIGSGLDFGEDYVGELLGEEVLLVTWLGEEQERRAFKLALTERPDSGVDFPNGTVWVDTETFVVLRGELNNQAGVLEQITTASDFVEFESQIEPGVLQIENVLENNLTEISFLERRTLEPLPDDVFTVETLGDFDPSEYGL